MEKFFPERPKPDLLLEFIPYSNRNSWKDFPPSCIVCSGTVKTDDGKKLKNEGVTVLKDRGFLVAVGNTNGSPLLYTAGNVTRLYRLLTFAAGTAAVLFSVGYLIGRLKRLKLF